ncbi:hypothetical protein Agub_g7064 [Astrephomene gubernaculifera]|uniref:Protein kinase domain-containing protein n=1 Tax=Astrephomene gubernaculifera TaxID=47775 RepID=A0AAD3DS40_9CHLO|nr:hypothetical protein Agub_g7064 [Astrephomene gubernaculifera]
MPGSCLPMDIPGRSYAWEGERMPHHLPSAVGEPCSSGRTAVGRPGSADLRSSANLPRSSRSGIEPVYFEAAEDVVGPAEYGPRRPLDLRVRPPSSSIPDSSPLPGRKSRRGSFVGFLGMKSGGSVQGSSKTPSREITMQGMVPSTVSAGHMRRHSFLHTIGFGTHSPAHEQEEPPGSGSHRSKPASQARRRRASMLDLFRHGQHPDSNAGGADVPSPTLDAPQQPLGRKSRRSSFIDFFRTSNTGMQGGADLTVSSPAVNRSGRNLSLRGEGVVSGRAQRRRSVIDILGHSSKKVLAKLMHHEYEEDADAEEEGEEGRLWFTSLADFKPLTFKYLSGRYSSAFFACSVKTGQHYILKQFEKEKMSLTDERGVRRALAFAQELHHDHIVRCCGTWEDEEALYIVEEYAMKGDLLQDSMSHPEKYTEAFMATKVVKPLLEVLVYLHGMDVVHRAIFPEYVMFGREDQLKLGHFTSAINQRIDPPNERIPFLDYMAPEMLAVRVDEPAGLFSAASAGSGMGTGRGTPTKAKGLNSQQTRVVRVQGLVGPSNDGSMPPGRGGYPGSGSPSMQPSPIPSGAYDTPEYGRPSPISVASRHGLFGGALSDLPGSPLSPAESLPTEKSVTSRTTSRSALSIFRSKRHLTSSQQPSDEDCSGVRDASSSQPWAGAPSRRLRSDTSEAPWSSPPSDGGAQSSGSCTAGPSRGMGHTFRRRKSALEEMSAPWLRPVDAGPSSDAGPGAGDGVVGGGGGAMQPSMEGDGVLVDSTAAAAAATAAGEEVAEGGAAAAAASSACIGGSGGGGGLPGSLCVDEHPTLVREPSEDPRSSSHLAPSSSPSCEPLDPSEREPQHLLGPAPPPPPQQLLRQPPEGFSSLRRQLSSAAMVAGAPVPRPASCASRAASSGQASSSARPSAPPSPHTPEQDGCLPGYAAGPAEAAGSIPSPWSLRQGSSIRAHRSNLGPGASPGAGSGLESGPVGEALVAETSGGGSSPGRYDSTDLSVYATDASVYAMDAGGAVSELKRGRTGVSFTTAAEEPADDGASVSSRPLRSRIASREASVTSAVQMISGLRSMARSITMKLGQAFGGLGGEGLGGTSAGDLLTAEVTDGGNGTSGGGGGGSGGGFVGVAGRETSPRQSFGGDATSIFVPNNPWEWQDQYDEKVDLWQVGCLVHEILCLSLPFEAEDKLLACALILWADITSFPDHLSPECHEFIRACLTKNPVERPSAADLLQHPWVARHAAGEVLKSVRQQREEANLAGLSAGQQLTSVQRAAAAVGLGWLVGVNADAAAAGSSSSGGGGSSKSQAQAWLGSWAWLLRPWTAKVRPAGGDSSKEGESKFERAVAMVQEQHQHELQQGVLGGLDASTRARGVGDLEAGQQGGPRRHSLDAARHSYQAFGRGNRPSRGDNASTRWGVVL